ARDAVLVRIGATTAAHRRLADRLGISDRTLFLESIPGEKLPLYYNAADLLAFPSNYEGFGLPPLEAMASGCPVVAADNSSLPEVVGRAGMLVASGDPAQWAEAIDAVLGSQTRSAELAAKGLARAREFTWERTAEQTINALMRM
ncbi:MAG TPA: glycosyltransferase, partial [Candidatus Edwardsbacteria bacterium]|nr:glycosyltransferase [Candidatus Edwardsbacteria bacterium]